MGCICLYSIHRVLWLESFLEIVHEICVYFIVGEENWDSSIILIVRYTVEDLIEYVFHCFSASSWRFYWCSLSRNSRYSLTDWFLSCWLSPCGRSDTDSFCSISVSSSLLVSIGSCIAEISLDCLVCDLVCWSMILGINICKLEFSLFSFIFCLFILLLFTILLINSFYFKITFFFSLI